MISFNGNNIESSYLVVNRLNKSDSPERDLRMETLSFQDGFEILRGYWRSRNIVITGMLDATSSTHLGSLLDTLKQNLSGINKNLDVDYGGATRRYKGTLSYLSAPEDFYNITHLPYTAEFICQPFGYGTSTVSITASDITASSHTDTSTYTGTYKPLPIITLTFTSATDATSAEITNNTTGDSITIEETITADDVLIVNLEEQRVTLNGTQVDFSGTMIEFEAGSNEVQISVGSTARDYDLSIVFTPRFL